MLGKVFFPKYWSPNDHISIQTFKHGHLQSFPKRTMLKKIVNSLYGYNTNR